MSRFESPPKHFQSTRYVPDPAHGFARNGITFGTQTETIPPSTRFGFPRVCNFGKFLKSCVKSLTRRLDYGINEATPLMAGHCLAEAVLPDRRPRGLCRKRRVESKERSRRSLNRHMGSLFLCPISPLAQMKTPRASDTGRHPVPYLYARTRRFRRGSGAAAQTFL